MSKGSLQTYSIFCAVGGMPGLCNFLHVTRQHAREMRGGKWLKGSARDVRRQDGRVQSVYSKSGLRR